MSIKKVLACTLAATAAFAAMSFSSCGKDDAKYVATAIESEDNEQYGLAIGKNSTNKEAILSAMNAVIAEIDIATIISYYDAIDSDTTPTVTLEFPDLSDNTAGTLQVYTNAEFPPFEFRDNDNNVVGADMYIMQLVAEEMNMKVSFHDVAFNSIVAKLAVEDNAIGAAGMTIYDEPKEFVDFSDPYFSTVQCIISKEDQAYSTLDQLAGKKIGVQKGTTGHIMIEDAINSGVLKDTGAQVIPYDDGPLAYNALKAGKCDVVVIDELPAKKLAR